MTDEDQVCFSDSPPDLGHMDTRFEENAEQDYKKARDENLPISERGNAFMRICEAASHSEEIARDIGIRKIALERVIRLSPELGTEKSANILTVLLFDPYPEIRATVLANISTFIEKTDDKSFETIIYNVVEQLGGQRSNAYEESKVLGDVAKHLMRSYSTQFFSALVAPSSVSKGSLRWLAANYPQLRSEIFSDGSEAGEKADRALMAALKSASAQLTDTIDEAMLAMDAMNTVVRTVQSVLGIYSDLLRVSGEPGIVIVSTALTSNAVNQGARGNQQSQPRTPETTKPEFPKYPGRGRNSSISQISPKTNIRRFSSEMKIRGATSTSGRYHASEVSARDRDDVASLPYTPSSQATPWSQYFSTPTTQQCQRSSSAPPTPTPSKRIFDEPEVQVSDESKRVRRERNSSKTPSPTHGSQRRGDSLDQSGSEQYRGNSTRGRYRGRNFIEGYRSRASYNGRGTYRPPYSWRGRQAHWGGRGEGGEHQSRYRSTDYPPRKGYE